jgi:hypothetical protein
VDIDKDVVPASGGMAQGQVSYLQWRGDEYVENLRRLGYDTRGVQEGKTKALRTYGVSPRWKDVCNTHMLPGDRPMDYERDLLVIFW